MLLSQVGKLPCSCQGQVGENTSAVSADLMWPVPESMNNRQREADNTGGPWARRHRRSRNQYAAAGSARRRLVNVFVSKLFIVITILHFLMWYSSGILVQME